MRGILECFYLNGEPRFSLREMMELTGLPIIGELYEEYVPLDSKLDVKSEEFWALFFLAMALFEYISEGQDKPKCLY